MESFDKYMKKHGETGVQALLDNWERSVGLRYNEPVSLEERWSVFINVTDTPAMAA